MPLDLEPGRPAWSWIWRRSLFRWSGHTYCPKLCRFGFGRHMISIIRLLYTALVARVLTRRLVSSAIDIHRGTKQGCPLKLPTNRGGLAATSIEHYYLAAQLQWVGHWLARSQLEDTATGRPSWRLEQVLPLFHSSHSKAPTPSPKLITVAHYCFHRSIRLTVSTSS